MEHFCAFWTVKCLGWHSLVRPIVTITWKNSSIKLASIGCERHLESISLCRLGSSCSKGTYHENLPSQTSKLGDCLWLNQPLGLKGPKFRWSINDQIDDALICIQCEIASASLQYINFLTVLRKCKNSSKLSIYLI